MTNQNCSTCFDAKAKYECSACQSAICKDCAQFVAEDRLAYMDAESAKQLVGVYCTPCFDHQIVPSFERYDEILERAKNVLIFTSEQGKETRLIKRSERPIKLADCEDRDELVMRLAYLAAKAGYNCLVDVDTTYEKRRDGSYKLAKWSGTGTPANVDPKRYDR